MNSDSVAFGGPLVALALGAIVLVFGIYQGGLTAIAMLGGLIGLLSIVWLFLSVSAVTP